MAKKAAPKKVVKKASPKEVAKKAAAPKKVVKKAAAPKRKPSAAFYGSEAARCHPRSGGR